MRGSLCLKYIQAQQQTIIEVRWVKHAVFIENERVGQSADPQKAVPVGGISRQTGSLQAEHNARLAQADFRDQFLKPFSIDSGGSGLAEITVDHDDSLHRPAQGHGMLAQTVLALGALGVFQYL